MGDSEKYESLLLRNQLCYPVYLCAKEITRKYTPFLSELDLTYTQYIVMMYFWEKKVSNVKEIGRTLLLDPSTLTPLLKKLEDKGYITIEYNKKGCEVIERHIRLTKMLKRIIQVILILQD